MREYLNSGGPENKNPAIYIRFPYFRKLPSQRHESRRTFKFDRFVEEFSSRGEKANIGLEK